MLTLNFDQKKTLALYEYFFGNKYKVNSEENDNTTVHVETQKMCYLLKVCGIEIGDFNYTWNFKGPFSPGLLAMLRSMDRNATGILNFYEQVSEKESFLLDHKSDINKLKDKLEIDLHQKDRMQWIEILGSLTYISRTMLPNADFEVANQRLIQEKPDYCDLKINEYAWNILNTANLLSY